MFRRLVCATLCLLPALMSAANDRPNILIITVDDMSCDSVGVYGCPVPDTTPAMDSFAKTALRFTRAHVQVGNCMPGRNLMWSGLYSHANGVEGFRPNPTPNYPVLCDLAKSAGYFTAIRGKASHSTPYYPYAWDAELSHDVDGKPHALKDPASYGKSLQQGIAAATAASRPFCVMVNISDPHKPFYSQTGNKPDPFVPSRVFRAQDVSVPGFLFDDPIVREELALYYSSVRRADDAVASVLQTLEATGHDQDTFVMFLSDHGMPLPFAKTQLYYHSTHTPLMVRWPGKTQPNATDETHFVSAIDFLPTLLDVMQVEHPTAKRLHGRSFANLLTGASDPTRTFVMTQYNENSGRSRHPMRGIITQRFLYLFNPWSDGVRKFATATTGTATYRRMKALAESDASIAARLSLFDHRVVEELYDIDSDPDCLNNLIDAESVQGDLEALRTTLANELRRVADPVAPLVRSIDDEDLVAAYMRAEDAKSKSLRKNRKPKPQKPNAKRRQATR